MFTIFNISCLLKQPYLVTLSFKDFVLIQMSFSKVQKENISSSFTKRILNDTKNETEKNTS